MASSNNKIDEVLSTPVMPEQTETERKLKNNLIVFSVISLFMCLGGLSISDKSRFLGLVFDGLTQYKIYIALFGFILYAAFHYLWYIKDSISGWRLRCTAISEIRPLRYSSNLENTELEDKRNNTLYHWWNYTKKYIPSEHLINEALIETITTLEKKISNEPLAADVPQLISKLEETKELLVHSRVSLSKLNEVLLSDPFQIALPRFNSSFRHFLVSQNIRWVIFELIVPFGLAVLSIYFLVDRIALLS
ncbi:hypothetical protein [Aeromonas allosaccharophila]|uniref:hypothetical protein n=1 Tax=Aeromonas allosaccharophila TaxID=656 RepID=UPI0036DDC423